MCFKIVNLKRVVAAFAVGVAFCTSAAAQDEAETLLRELKTAPESDSARIERTLRIVWSRSGSAAMDLLLTRGLEALEADDTTTAIEHLTALTDHAPDFAEGWSARARAYHRAGLYGPALDDIETALVLNPNDFNALFGLGVMFEEFGDLKRAEAAFLQVLALHPHHENATRALDQLKGRGVGRTL